MRILTIEIIHETTIVVIVGPNSILSPRDLITNIFHYDRSSRVALQCQFRVAFLSEYLQTELSLAADGLLNSAIPNCNVVFVTFHRCFVN